MVDTFDYMISSLDKVSDEILTKGKNKEKSWVLSGHSNLDLILLGESHTTHITELRLLHIYE